MKAVGLPWLEIKCFCGEADVAKNKTIASSSGNKGNTVNFVPLGNDCDGASAKIGQ